MTPSDVRAQCEEEMIDARLWLEPPYRQRRADAVLDISDDGICQGILNRGQPVHEYYEQLVGAMSAIALIDDGS